MAFNQIIRRGIPGLSKCLQNPGQLSALNRAVPSIVINRSSSVNLDEEIKKEEGNQISFLQVAYERVNKMFTSEPCAKVQCEQEQAERRALWDKVGALYYMKPPQSPTAETYIEGFELLMKWGDWRGLQGLWHTAENELMVFDDDIVDKVEDFLLDARRRSWNE